MYWLSPVICPHKGIRTDEDLTRLYSRSHPWVGRNKERAKGNVSSVREDKLAR
jgi:hypothetical protein